MSQPAIGTTERAQALDNCGDFDYAQVLIMRKVGQEAC